MTGARRSKLEQTKSSGDASLVEYILDTADEILHIDSITQELKRSPLADDTSEEHRKLMVR
jgi:hypothetical protein